MTEFPGLIFPGERKVLHHTPEGAREYRVKVRPGFYLFQGKGFNARVLRPAEIWEKEQAIGDASVINCLTTLHDENKHIWYCHPANLNQPGAEKVRWPAPLYFPEEDLSLLQPIKAWVIHKIGRRILVYKEPNFRYPMNALNFLRNTIEHPLTARQGTSEEWTAYKFVVDKHTPKLERLVKEALRFVHAGFVKLEDRGHGQHTVTYTYGGETSRVVINDRLTTLDSGICLNGGDRDFDLGSVIIVKHRRRW